MAAESDSREALVVSDPRQGDKLTLAGFRVMYRNFCINVRARTGRREEGGVVVWAACGFSGCSEQMFASLPHGRSSCS
jgi:hypothetical protein